MPENPKRVFPWICQSICIHMYICMSVWRVCVVFVYMYICMCVCIRVCVRACPAGSTGWTDPGLSPGGQTYE